MAEIPSDFKSVCLKVATLQDTPESKLALKEILTGAAYALAKSYRLDYSRDASAVSRSDYLGVASILIDLSRGTLPNEGQWLAGFYFNSALLRIAAGYHRTLKILTGENEGKHCLKLLARERGLISDHELSSIETIWKEVNDFKHSAVRSAYEINSRRTVDLKEALEGLRELVELASRCP